MSNQLGVGPAADPVLPREACRRHTKPRRRGHRIRVELIALYRSVTCGGYGKMAA